MPEAKGDEYYLPAGNTVQDLTGGRMVAPGESVVLDGDAVKDPHNKALIERGVLVKVTKADKEAKPGDEGGEKDK